MTKANSIPIGSNSRQWFIHDLRWSLLISSEEQSELKKYCDPKFYRGTADGITLDELGRFEDKFRLVEDITAIAYNRHTIRDEKAQWIDFKYVSIIADSGVGKTIVTRQIQYLCSQPNSRTIPFRFDLRTTVQRHHLEVANAGSRLLLVLATLWHETLPEEMRQRVSIQNLQEKIMSMARCEGKIVLIIDGLDQCSTSDLDVLRALVESANLIGCRFVVAGRSQAYITNWDSLFGKRPWKLVRVENPTRQQQIRYLGWLSDGSLRFNKIPAGARPVLRNARILSYLRTEREFSKIHTAADVLWKSVDRLISDAMSRSDKGSLIGLSAGRTAKFDPVKERFEITTEQVRTAINLLAIVAFETKRHAQRDQPTWRDWRQDGRLPSKPEDPVPTYAYNVVVESEVDRLRREQIRLRFELKRLDGDFESNWSGIAALNSGFLEHGLFEDDRGGLKELVWANRTLHEFLLAYFFANLADEADTDYLWDWIYLKDQYGTEDYYWFWQYFVEMPEHARCEVEWLQAVRMIFQRTIYGDQEADPPATNSRNQRSSSKLESAATATSHSLRKRPLFAKRSTEMLFRSWKTLHEYIAKDQGVKSQRVKGQATTILEKWQSEFEWLRDGGCGSDLANTAQSVVDHLLFVDLAKIGRFRMGTSPEKQGPDRFTESVRTDFERLLDQFRDSPDSIAEFFDRFGSSKGALAFREYYEPEVRRIARVVDRSEASQNLANLFFPMNEAEKEYTDLPNSSFPNYFLGRYPINNRQFRLFDPTHGIRSSELWPDYATYSETNDSPVIYASFFDAWVFSQFLYWEGAPCYLPHEDQWECAAKFGFGWEDWTRRYWWGDDFVLDQDRKRVVCEETRHVGSMGALPPDKSRSNPLSIELLDPGGLGFCDLLGNVWEWTSDPIPNLVAPYDRNSAVDRMDPTIRRVVRGGSFAYVSVFIRCSLRFSIVPIVAYICSGFRVARAPS